MNTMPVIFSGHGSPMIALDHNALTETFRQIGETVVKEYGRPKAILTVSGHWFVGGTYIQSATEPKQIYDMYGFPEALYQVKYPVKGCKELTEDVEKLLGDRVSVNDEWGIDHGTWTVLVHMFPKADIPVVQLSVNRHLNAEKSYALGKLLQPLRDKGYIIFASGNIVHNLRAVEWDNPHGSPAADRFDAYIRDAVKKRDDGAVIHFDKHPDAAYAVPTPDHYLPLLYALGAAQGDKADEFNTVRNLGSMSMTGFFFHK